MGGPGDLPRIPFAFQVGFGIQHYAATVRLDTQLVLFEVIGTVKCSHQGVGSCHDIHH
jgi:hypothetical protein